MHLRFNPCSAILRIIYRSIKKKISEILTTNLQTTRQKKYIKSAKQLFSRETSSRHNLIQIKISMINI